ncbi:Uncharacterised protein [Serratia fonticola]|jgi:hypothetical protein|uniref:Uncharacterized protein n=1 Tax=Serratia fonticola TaxID=47917 RepID=A0A3S5AX11_SERFO|nr:Uncharacterised protein [Serratia fonticola]CAI0716411.1 Uncharacterised protein [Serratia fonticola]CAI0716707.1 Uncharacterised protein [Serratia fonticola]CAI0946551.1 Uncharacterised protein [Serratia fonticola]CAI1543326.1 Uncharacterised protein [Serratia fonticola]
MPKAWWNTRPQIDDKVAILLNWSESIYTSIC